MNPIIIRAGYMKIYMNVYEIWNNNGGEEYLMSFKWWIKRASRRFYFNCGDEWNRWLLFNTNINKRFTLWETTKSKIEYEQKKWSERNKLQSSDFDWKSGNETLKHGAMEWDDSRTQSKWLILAHRTHSQHIYSILTISIYEGKREKNAASR